MTSYGSRMRRSLQQPIATVFEAVRGTPYTGMLAGKATPKKATPPAYRVTWIPPICSNWLGSALPCRALLCCLRSALLFGSDPTGVHVAASQNRDAMRPAHGELFPTGSHDHLPMEPALPNHHMHNLVEGADL